MEQCEAAGAIKERYGLKAAFDYLVGEKLLNFTEAASEHRAFAQELPRFVSAVRQMFSAEEIVAHLARIEHEQRVGASNNWLSFRAVRVSRVKRDSAERERWGSWDFSTRTGGLRRCRRKAIHWRR
jgi:hypothetical protein